MWNTAFSLHPLGQSKSRSSLDSRGSDYFKFLMKGPQCHLENDVDTENSGDVSSSSFNESVLILLLKGANCVKHNFPHRLK